MAGVPTLPLHQSSAPPPSLFSLTVAFYIHLFKRQGKLLVFLTVQQALVSEPTKDWPSFHADIQFRGHWKGGKSEGKSRGDRG